MKKRLLCVLATVAILTSSVSVFAVPTNLKEVYNTAEDQVENLDTKGDISPNTHKTVTIVKTHELDGTDLTGNDVSTRTVYVDQSSSVYSSALTVMLDNLNGGTGLTTGYYTATMGTVTDTSYESVNFVVGEYEVDPDDVFVVLDEAEAYGQGTLAGTSTTTWYKKSFTKTISYDEYNSFNSLQLVSEDGSKYLGAISLHKDYTTSTNTHGFSWDKTKLTGTGDVTIALQIYAIPEAETGFKLYLSTAEVTEQ